MRGWVTPSRFEGDPYGGLTNQWGHYSGAAGAFLIIAAASFLALGEMPHKLPIAAALVVGYVTIGEWALQGWQGWDTVEDSTFVALGVSTVALSVSERSAEGYTAIIAVDVPMLLLHLVGASIGVFVYAWRRVK